MTAHTKRSVCRGGTALLTCFAAFCLCASSRAEFEITTGLGSTTQNFDSLANSGTNNPFVNATTVTAGDSTLEGWSLFNFVNVPISAYNAGAGTSTTGIFYIFGSDTAADRALGGLGSGGNYFGAPASGTVA